MTKLREILLKCRTSAPAEISYDKANEIAIDTALASIKEVMREYVPKQEEQGIMEHKDGFNQCRSEILRKIEEA